MKKEKCMKTEYSHEQPEPDKYKDDGRKAKHKTEMAGSQTGTELDQKIIKSLEKGNLK